MAVGEGGDAVGPDDALLQRRVAHHRHVQEADRGPRPEALLPAERGAPVDRLHPVIDVVGPGEVHQPVVPVEEEHRPVGLVELRERRRIGEVDAILGQQRIGEGRVEAAAGLGLDRRAPEIARGVDQAFQLASHRLIAGRAGRGRNRVPGRGDLVPGPARGGPEVTDLQIVRRAGPVHWVGRAPEGVQVAVEGARVAPERLHVAPERLQVPVEGL